MNLGIDRAAKGKRVENIGLTNAITIAVRAQFNDLHDFCSLTIPRNLLGFVHFSVFIGRQ